MADDLGSGAGRPRSPLRIARWVAVTTLILLVPLVMMQFSAEWNWSLGDFIVVGALLMSVGVSYELAVRKTGDTAYRAGAGLALAGALILMWVNGAAGITDSVADALFVLLVVPIGILGSIIARFQPRGMARAMFATASAQALVGLGALIAGVVPAYNAPAETLGLTGFFAMIFVASALLFRQAASGKPNERVA
jgi:hypothetical protein